MQEFTINLLKHYLTGNSEYNIADNVNMDFIRYHRIDMLYYEYLLNVGGAQNDQLMERKDKIQTANSSYLCIAKRLSEELLSRNIPHVFLKGLSCIINTYKEQWHRYFSDIDMLVDKSQINSVEKILREMGYVFATPAPDKKSLLPASREDILFQKTYTHEIYNMARIEDSGWISNIDVNFLFSWNGIGENTSVSLMDMADHIVVRDGYHMFDNIANMLHMCCHVYNEAMYFALNKHFVEGDPREIQLHRIFDIAILSECLTENDCIELFKLSEKFGFCEKTIYAISLTNHLLNLDIATKYFSISRCDRLEFYQYVAKDKQLATWPISIKERVFDLDKRQEAVKKLFPCGSAGK